MLKICLTICTYLSFTLAINGDADKAKLWQGEDAIVVKAITLANEAIPASVTRIKRQFGNDLRYEYMTSPTCYTRTGMLGRCLDFNQCYPFFKLPSLLQYESWMMSMQDTCPIMTPSGKQDFGVCCSDFRYITSNHFPVFPPHNTVDNDDPPGRDNTFYKWPPPVPTHPPDHTPATHPPTQKPSTVKWPPPLPSYPTKQPGPGVPPPPSPIWPISTNPTTQTTQKPQWPPTNKPTTNKPNWPSKPTWTSPTKPVTKPTLKPEWSIPGKPTTSKPEWPVTISEAEDLPGNVSECGIKNGYQDQERIVGGHNAEPGEWPWMAAILTSGRLFCGGSLIDNIHILTAAHCVAHMNPWDVARLRIHLGDHNIKSKGDVQHIERKVKKVVRHRGFDPTTLYNDIALLTLDMPVMFSKNVRPVCLPYGKTLYSGRTATVIGWGSLREMGPTPGVLQEVNIPIWSNSECKSKYGPAAPGGIVDSFLCAGKDWMDSCSGDSGGPLMINDGKWQQIGIVSWGIGCGKGQFPGVYTRVSSFMNWINKNLNV